MAVYYYIINFCTHNPKICVLLTKFGNSGLHLDHKITVKKWKYVYACMTTYDIMEYFMQSETDNIEDAMKEFDGDFEEQPLRLMRIKFYSEVGN